MCGNRTAPCETCGRPVKIKDMELHIQVHFMGEKSKTPVKRDFEMSGRLRPLPLADLVISSVI